MVQGKAGGYPTPTSPTDTEPHLELHCPSPLEGSGEGAALGRALTP